MPDWAKLRKAGSLTQHKLGVLAEVGRNKIANVETGRAVFTEAERSRVLAVLEVHIRMTVKTLNETLAPDSPATHQGTAA